MNDFSNTSITVDDAFLQKVSDNMSKDGLSQQDINTIQKELKEIAGSDKIIKGSEFQTLFNKLDSHDKNGSSSSFLLNKTVNGVSTQTVCGSVVDSLLSSRAKSSTMTLDAFKKEFASAEVKVDQQLLSKVNTTLGGKPYNMSVADRNRICNNLKEIAGNDGVIKGSELQHLFKELDRHDHNGDGNSFIVSNNSQNTVSGELLGIAEDAAYKKEGITTADLLKQFSGQYLRIYDISPKDLITLTALGLDVFDLKGCTDGLFSLKIPSSNMDQLVEKLDKLDGEKDQQVTTSHSFINGKNAEKTKAGEALDILQKYIQTEPAAEQPKVEEPKGEQPKVEQPKVDNGNGASGVGTKPVATTPSSKNPASVSGASVTEIDVNLEEACKSSSTYSAVAKNRSTIDKTRTKISTNVKYAGRVTDGNMYGGIKTGTPSAYSDPNVTAAQKAVLREICREGGWTSINTYDNQIFTFGQGYSALATLPKVMKYWFEGNPSVAKEFAKYGIGVSQDGKLQVLDTGKNKILTGSDAAKYIKAHIELQHLFVNIGEDPAFLQSLIDAQTKYLMNDGAAVIPSYAQNWKEEYAMAAAHIQHWLPAISWKSISYSDCKNGVDIIRKAYGKMGKDCAAGKAWTKSGFSSVTSLNKDTYVISKSLGMDHIKGWGDGAIKNELLAVAGNPVAISDSEIRAGKYAGKILLAEGNGKYYVINQ